MTTPAYSAVESNDWNAGIARAHENVKPPDGGTAFNNSGYATKLNAVPGSTPDPYRLGYLRPTPFTSNGVGNEQTTEQRFGEKLARNNYDFTVDPLPPESAQPTRLERAPDPRWLRPGPSRITELLQPTGYYSVRPFDHRTPDRFNGEHFSMATHKRTYDNYGMAPANPFRSTRREESVPHGVLNYDKPSPSPYLTSGVTNVPGTIPGTGRYLRSDRLGY